MKKKLLLIILLFISSFSFAQSKWGLQLNTSIGGYKENMYKYSAKTDDYTSPSLSYNVQLVGYYDVYKKLKVGLGLGYLTNTTQYILEVQYDDADPVLGNPSPTVQTRRCYLNIPVNIKYNFSLSNKLYIPAEINGTAYFNTSNKGRQVGNSSWQSFELWDKNDPLLSAGISSGLGYFLNQNISLEAVINYSAYLNDLRKGNEYFSDLKGKNTIWGGINLAYKF